MTFQFGDFRLDEAARQLLRGDVEVHLSPKAFDLLALLIRTRPRAISKADLHAGLWPQSFVSDASLATLVAEVRGALHETARAPRFVRTVHRHGYAFRGNAIEIAGPESPIGRSPVAYWIVAPLRQVALAAGENIVGRDPRAHVWLDSPSVSRRHARITVDGDRVTLEDLKSKNRTHMRGAPITDPVPLSDGDEIRFGSVNVTFRVWAADASTKGETDA